MSYLTEGHLTLGELKSSPNYPSEERLHRGPCVVIECVQDIPCNPCESVCPHGAITIGSPITNLPVFDAQACNGCGTCIAVCPGQAIFLVDKTYEKDHALVAFPFEYLPVPEKGQPVDAVNRAGEVIAEGTVVRVVNAKRNDRTPVVSIRVPKNVADEVRSIRRQSLVKE